MVYIVNENGVHSFRVEEVCDYFQNSRTNQELIKALHGSTELFIGNVRFSLTQPYQLAELYSIVFGIDLKDQQACQKLSEMTYLTVSYYIEPNLYLFALEQLYNGDINNLDMIADMMHELCTRNVTEQLQSLLYNKLDNIIHNPAAKVDTLRYIAQHGNERLHDAVAKELKQYPNRHLQACPVDCFPYHPTPAKGNSINNITRFDR